MAAVLSTATAATTVPQPIRSSDLLLPQPTCLSHSSHSFAPSLSRNCTRPDQYSASRAAGRLARKRSDWFAYLAATVVMSSFGITSMVVMAFVYWFEWQMEGGRVPLFEMSVHSLSLGALLMEFLARWAHRALWHASLWHPYEGLAMTYVFIHRAFCMGPIANVVRRIVVDHQMATGEGKYRRVKSLVLLALLGGLNVVASASSTLSFTNTCSIPIFPSLIPKDGSPKISNSTSLHAIGPNEELSVPLPDGWSGIAIFSTGCILNGLGARNCTTGNCKGRECTVEDSPVATGLDISSDIYTMSTDMGYNVGLTVSPMCAGCDCPSASCKALLESCPPDLRVFNEGTVVACRPGSGLQFSENQCTVPGDYGTSDVSITCPLKNIVMKIEVSC